MPRFKTSSRDHLPVAHSLPKLSNVKHHWPAACGAQPSFPGPLGHPQPLLLSSKIIPEASTAQAKSKQNEEGPTFSRCHFVLGHGASGMSSAPSSAVERRGPRAAVLGKLSIWFATERKPQVPANTAAHGLSFSVTVPFSRILPRGFGGLEKAAPPSSWASRPAQGPEPEAGPEGVVTHLKLPSKLRPREVNAGGGRVGLRCVDGELFLAAEPSSHGLPLASTFHPVHLSCDGRAVPLPCCLPITLATL